MIALFYLCILLLNVTGVPNPWKLGKDKYCYVETLQLMFNGVAYNFLDASGETAKSIFDSHLPFMQFLIASGKFSKFNASNIDHELYHLNCAVYGKSDLYVNGPHYLTFLSQDLT